MGSDLTKAQKSCRSIAHTMNPSWFRLAGNVLSRSGVRPDRLWQPPPVYKWQASSQHKAFCGGALA